MPHPMYFLLLLCAVVDSIVYSFFSATELQRNFLLLFFEQGFLPGLYTAIVSIMVVVFIPGRKLY